MSINDEGPPPKRRTISKRDAGKETTTTDMDRVDEEGSDMVSSSEKSSSSEKVSTRQSPNQQQPINDQESGSESEQEVEAEETTSSSGSDSDESDEDEHSESEDENSDEGNPSGDLDDPLSSQGQQRPTALPPIGERSGLRSRLQEFLPQLQKANVELESSSDILDKRIDHVDDGAEQYIEMNLGLGVLSEQRPGEDDEVRLEPTTDTSSDQGTDEDDEAEQRMESSAEDVLTRLRGEKAQKASKRKVEELG
ncbi:hypothetical protein HRR83_007700 [Exophiala dermatitidis]|uniref:Uncharacterized protein n=1 Tax=Exophiala dermatitidis TaxID=5970 RepID=A0AAN6IS79_EXODE|nr:hypothetical protein HRR73_008931 [Exophiala dermatitidis]KAJ4507773.1 hypothetical protein HRR75_006483 [Exophiala dermatitidis]KAJ4509911.1 hypothetical protein HRR74_007063 [Exophiala dermatitidis]KAJ4539535.1 hypothetical protein HRR77_006416 [Exophiala dermatitidis]KAJ4542688.1 hypothetical protein HRR78_006777 [Exophiala dermatitidis]